MPTSRRSIDAAEHRTTSTAADRRAYRYLLGDSPRESNRLSSQAKLWDPTALELFDRIGVRPGWKVLEIGPGQGSILMELRRRIKGPVDVVERSPVFADAISRLIRRDGYGPGNIWRTDLIDAPLPPNRYDFIWARFVFLFLPETEAHIRKLMAALKPGGILAIQDYHRPTFTMIPTPPEWDNFLEADMAFFASEGGNGSVATSVHEIYRKLGMDIVEITPTIKQGKPGSPVWKWVTTYFQGVMPRMADMPPFSPAQARRLSRFWRDAARHGEAVIIAPAVVDLVARKPRRRPSGRR